MSLLLRSLLPSSMPPPVVVGKRQPSSRRSSFPCASHRYISLNGVSLKASASLSDSSPSIFLPFLEENEEEEEVVLAPEEKIEDEVEEEVDLEFFNSRASITKDSFHESKLRLKNNRRTSWHLEIEKAEEPEGSLMEPDCDGLSSAETGNANWKLKELWRGY